MKKQIKEVLQYVLAGLIIVCSFALVALLLFYPIPKENTETLNLATGALLAAFGAIVQFFFGSSAGSQRKTDMLTKLENDENK